MTVVVGAALIFANRSHITEEGECVVWATAVKGIALDAVGVIRRVAIDAAVDVTGEVLFSLVTDTQPAFLTTVLETVGPMATLGCLGACIGAGGIRHGDPLVTVLAIV